MRLRTFDELTPSMDVDRLLVHLSSLGGATDRRSVAVWRRRSNVFAEYVGVFAEERGRIVGQTLVKRLPYTFPRGTEPIGALASVGTRPDLRRRGVARQILTEVHRLEAEAGIRYVALWTNRSWGAHRLYERLGYRDVYPFPWAARPPRAPSRIGGRAHRCRPATVRDLPELERLHDRTAEGRLGFCRRPARLLQTMARTHELRAQSDLIVTPRRGEIAGYAHLQSTAVRTVCGELVAASNDVRASLVAEVERRARGSTVAFQQTPVTDTPALFRRRGYTLLDDGWYVLMAGALGRRWTPRTAVTEFATHDRRFQCLGGDRF